MTRSDAGEIDRECENFLQMSDDIMNNMRLAARHHRSIRRAKDSFLDMDLRGIVHFFSFKDDHVQLHPIIFRKPSYSDDASPAMTYGTLVGESSYALATWLFDVGLNSATGRWRTHGDFRRNSSRVRL
ncbi:hypothetical protein MRX96_023677 [Rhipicephalus microplus]